MLNLSLNVIPLYKISGSLHVSKNENCNRLEIDYVQEIHNSSGYS